jgi:hypothetical protein
MRGLHYSISHQQSQKKLPWCSDEERNYSNTLSLSVIFQIQFEFVIICRLIKLIHICILFSFVLIQLLQAVPHCQRERETEPLILVDKSTGSLVNKDFSPSWAGAGLNPRPDQTSLLHPVA